MCDLGQEQKVASFGGTIFHPYAVLTSQSVYIHMHDNETSTKHKGGTTLPYRANTILLLDNLGVLLTETTEQQSKTL